MKHDRIPPAPPPPCDHVCWEPLGPNGWTFIASEMRCGHRWDRENRVWRTASNHPTPPRRTDP